MTTDDFAKARRTAFPHQPSEIQNFLTAWADRLEKGVDVPRIPMGGGSFAQIDEMPWIRDEYHLHNKLRGLGITPELLRELAVIIPKLTKKLTEAS